MINNKIVFSDLDATLLDHNSYSYAKALPGVEKLRECRIPLILVSSKTYDEMLILSKELKLNNNFIFENGAGIAEFSGNSYTPRLFSHNADELYEYKNLLENVCGKKIKMFNDMDAQEVVKLTGLSIEKSELAKKRMGSQPFIFLDNDFDDMKITEINEIIKKNNLSLTKGGRFYHLISADTSKGKAVRFLLKGLSKATISMGIGDSINDVSMLYETNYPFLVKRFDGTHVAVADEKLKQKIHFCENIGPEGFSEAIEYFIEK